MIADRKTAILEAFKNLVRRFGVDKTTMQDVAREAGISVGMIYKDFINKDDLVDAYIQNLISQILFECQKLAQQNKPPKELLHDVLIGFCSQLEEHVSQDRGFFQCIFGDVQIGQFRQKTIQYEDAFEPQLRAFISRILQQGQDEGVFEVDNIPEVASCLLDAFGFFTLEIVLCAKYSESEVILPRAEQMFNFIIKAIEKR